MSMNKSGRIQKKKCGRGNTQLRQQDHDPKLTDKIHLEWDANRGLQRVLKIESSGIMHPRGSVSMAYHAEGCPILRIKHTTSANAAVRPQG